MLTAGAALLLVLAGSGPAGSSAAPALLSPLDPRSGPGSVLAGNDAAAEDVRRLHALLASAPTLFPLRGIPSAVRIAFVQPFALPELARAVTEPAVADRDRPFRAVARFAARAFGVADPTAEERSTLAISDPQRAVFALDFLLNEPNLILRTALGPAIPEAGRAAAAREAIADALSTTSRSSRIREPLLDAMRASATLDRAALVRAAAHLDVALEVAGDWKSFEPEQLPAELAGAVDGTVLAAQLVPELGWVVVGGPGDNRYDMSRVAAVFDAGGNDRFEWGNAQGSRLVIDAAGDDVHTTPPPADPSAPPTGPAGAVGGMSVIIDLAGDDTYQCVRNGIGAAVLGVGILVDKAGNDVYRGGEWTCGAAFAGIGAVCDAGGNDLYLSECLSQGCGGPGGAGLLADASGNDRYRTDGSVPSAYGTPTVHCSFAQGAGFGYRAGAAGGVGALVDGAGDDRYEAGEFAQGIGYFLSMGILRDGGGRDLYYGNRYAQGTAAHQAFGALLEDSGDDIYWSMTAAGQGAAWDESAAVLVDRAGDDRYQADGLSQGAAAQQAIGFLADLSGRDDYRAAGASQGAADGNDYHWDSTRCTSLGVLLDAGGPNRFLGAPGGHADGASNLRGDPAAEKGRTRWGIFVSR